MKKITYLISVLMFVLFVSQSLVVYGIGQMTEPIVVENARQGESFEEVVYIFNTEKIENKFKLSAEEGIEGWVKFYDRKNPEIYIKEIIIPENSRYDIVAKFEIPKGTPNGQYEGAIGVEIIPSEDDLEKKVLTTVGQKVNREVRITVMDEEEIDLRTSIIPETYNLKKDEPLNIRFVYDNQSNIKISPQIQLKLKKNGKLLYNVIYPYPEEIESVNSFSMKEITPLRVQTIGMEEGKYVAETTIIVNEEKKYDDRFSFTIGKTAGINNSVFLNFISYLGRGNILVGWFFLGGLVVVLAIFAGFFWKKKSFCKSNL